MAFSYSNLYNNKVIIRCVLFFLPIIIFSPVLFKGFAIRDDGWMLINNPYVFNLRIENIVEYFTSFYKGQYSPVNTLFYGVIYYFFDLKPFWFHLFCLLFHSINVLLVYRLIKKIFVQQRINKALVFSDVDITRISFLSALIFGIHPLQVETISWISASKIILYVMFSLLSLTCYLTYKSSNNKYYYLLSIVLFIVSFGAKEQAVILPCLLILIDYISESKINKRSIFDKLPFFLIALVLGIVELKAQSIGFQKTFTEYYPLHQRLILSCFSIIEYLFKALIPINLSFYYRFPMSYGADIPNKYLIYPFFLALLTLFVIKSHISNRKYIVFGLLFFVANLFLSLHIIPMARHEFIAGRYVYLALMGLSFLLTTEANRYLKTSPLFLKKSLSYCIYAYLIYLTGYSYYYAQHWM